MRLRALILALLSGLILLIPAQGKTRTPKDPNAAEQRVKPPKARKFKPAKYKLPKYRESKRNARPAKAKHSKPPKTRQR